MSRVWCGEMRCGEVWCGEAWCGEMHCGVVCDVRGTVLTFTSPHNITSFQALLYSPRTNEQLTAMRSARAWEQTIK